VNKLTIGIDASNLRAGGGLTYLANLLDSDAPKEAGIHQVIVWGGRRTLERLPQRAWLTLAHEEALDGSLASRALWQHRLDRVAMACDVLFVPGGRYLGNFRPFVTMSHNLLPFDANERRRFGLSAARFRLELLRVLQTKTFQRATGVIFLTESARIKAEESTGLLPGRCTTIPHGVDSRFRLVPRQQCPLSAFSESRPFRWLYVSIVNLYKHQWNVVAAVAQLRAAGLPVTLDLVGPAFPPALQKLRGAMDTYDPSSNFVRYIGPVAHPDLAAMYHQADALVFASTCENMPIILLEGMAAGLPIVSGNRPVMREVLRDGGEYCNPESSQDLARAMERVTRSRELRHALASRAFSLSEAYDWRRSALATFQFLAGAAVHR